MPTPLSIFYCTEGDAIVILSQIGVHLRLDDDNSGTVSTSEDSYLLSQGINWATDLANLHLLQRYLASDLANSWLVNSWSAWLVAYFVCQRRLNAVPDTMVEQIWGKDENPGVMGYLKQVFDYRFDLPGIAEQDLT